MFAKFPRKSFSLMISVPCADKYTSFSEPRSKKSPNRLQLSNQQPCSKAHCLSLTSWTDLQVVVPARVSISLRTPYAKADALSSMPPLPISRHSPSCDNRLVLSPLFILSTYSWLQIYSKNLKFPSFLKKILFHCTLFHIYFVSLPSVRGEIRTNEAFAYSKDVLEVWPQIDASKLE